MGTCQHRSLLALRALGTRTRGQESWGGGSPSQRSLAYAAKPAWPSPGEVHSLTISLALAGDLGHVAKPRSALGGLTPPTSRVMTGSKMWKASSRLPSTQERRKIGRRLPSSFWGCPELAQSSAHLQPPGGRLPPAHGAGGCTSEVPGPARGPGSRRGCGSPAPNIPGSGIKAMIQLLGSGCERRQRGVPGGACGGRRPRPTSSSRVTVFLQLCSRVVKLDVVGEL